MSARNILAIWLPVYGSFLSGGAQKRLLAEVGVEEKGKEIYFHLQALPPPNPALADWLLSTPHVLWLQDTSRWQQIMQIRKQSNPATHEKRSHCKVGAWIKAPVDETIRNTFLIAVITFHYNQAQWFDSSSPDPNSNFFYLFSHMYFTTYWDNIWTQFLLWSFSHFS